MNIATNFTFSEQAISFLQRHIALSKSADGNGKALMPAIIWTLGGYQENDGKISKSWGPGYIVGAYRHSQFDDTMIMTRINGQDIIIRLENSYDAEKPYRVDLSRNILTISNS